MSARRLPCSRAAVCGWQLLVDSKVSFVGTYAELRLQCGQPSICGVGPKPNCSTCLIGACKEGPGQRASNHSSAPSCLLQQDWHDTSGHDASHPHDFRCASRLIACWLLPHRMLARLLPHIMVAAVATSWLCGRHSLAPLAQPPGPVGARTVGFSLLPSAGWIHCLTPDALPACVAAPLNPPCLLLNPPCPLLNPPCLLLNPRLPADAQQVLAECFLSTLQKYLKVGVPCGGRCTASRSVAAKVGGLLPAHAVWPTCHTICLHIGTLPTALTSSQLWQHLTPNATPLLPHPPGSNASF